MPIIEELSDEEDDATREARWAKQAEEEAERVQGQFDKGEACRAEGTTAFAEGNYEEAIECWRVALNHLLTVGNEPENREKAYKANLVLHLNVAQGCLKMEDFQGAKDAATSAWLIDQKSVKALYRRAQAHAGLARKAEHYHEADAKLAVDDLKELLRNDPTNTDAKRLQREVQLEMRAEREKMLEKQKETWAGKLGGRTETADDDKDEKDEEEQMHRPYVEKAVQGGRHSIIYCENAAVGKGRNGPDLSDVTMNLCEKWCVGIYAKEGPEKKALLKLITHKVRPSAGKIEYPKKPKTGVNPEELKSWQITHQQMGACWACTLALLWGMVKSKLELPFFVMACVLLSFVVPLVSYLWYEQQILVNRPPAVLHMTAEGCKEWRPSKSKTVLQLLETSLPSRIPKKDRPDRAKNLLKAAGLEDLDGNALFGSLEPDQQQLVYILRSFVLRTRVLICDDALRELSNNHKSRMLRMMRRMKQDCNTSVLYITSDMQQLSLVSDSLGVLSGGKLCELGPAEEVLARPRHPDVKELVQSAEMRNMLKTGIVEGSEGGLRDFYNDLIKDSALEAMWLPKHKD